MKKDKIDLEKVKELKRNTAKIYQNLGKDLYEIDKLLSKILKNISVYNEENVSKK